MHWNSALKKYLWYIESLNKATLNLIKKETVILVDLNTMYRTKIINQEHGDIKMSCRVTTTTECDNYL